ncbi:YhdP family protein [Azonexus sp.]|uniref:YhdP family protein n=1 Tax=Azonexus sp. TaxID=1872668 RepID=UPI002827C07C|nr:YhdP family protein [Azonexus sp.]MDR1994514.1 TIGR02099 family protein [Azonexus sp.]
MTEPVRPSPVVRPSPLRVAIYHRLHWLWPLLLRPAVQRGLRLLGWTAFAAWLLLVLVVLLLRYAILPQIGEHKAEIEQAASRVVGQQVSIGHIAARWQGLNPDLILDDVRLLDAGGEPTFTLARVEGVLSWQSLWRWRPVLALLAFDGPVLQIRRDSAGHITVAGISATADGDSGFADWVLAQKRIRIRDATIVWDDQLRQAPSLLLEDFQFALDNRGRNHSFGLSAAPPAALADRLDIRGEIIGNLGEAFEKLAGKVFVQVDYADLAGWRAWVDYPIDLPQGRGALRIWGDLANAGGTVTADLALEELRLRLQPALPELNLDSLRGRLEGRYKTGEWSLRGRKLELLTHQGVRIAPTDFLVTWRQEPGSRLINGNASASFLDLGVLAALAEYLPLDEHSRQLLNQHRPQGQVSELRASWGIEDETLKRYALQAAFSGLGMLPGGAFPGGSGLSGRIDLSEKGGDLMLDSERSTLSLPAVFPEPDIALDTLRATARWTVAGGSIDVRLPRLEFASPDAAGEAHGNYRFSGDGPGVIDLQATLARADGRAVWRYLPLAVGADARDWVRRGITGGRASDAKLILKGNLADFPFRDSRSGQFRITAKVADARVDYADGWPLIDGIDADMEFGVGMRVTARSGRILGARLSDVTVVIPDFESAEEMLLVRGVAAGPTGAFLNFIERSPVAGDIDRFTEGMHARGDGHLDLELDLPLQHIDETRVRGRYRFQNNELELLDGLPPLTQVNGLLNFTEATIAAQEITGRVFGGPFKIQIRNAGDKVDIKAGGTAAIAEVSRHFAWPLVDRLSGSTAWRADIGIRKREAEVVIQSDLVGIVSPLPEPLGKAATAPLPLRIERSALNGGREQYRVSLGMLGRATVVRRDGALERGVVVVGEADARLPDRGLAVRITAPRLDADAWRDLLPQGGGSAGGSAIDGSLELAQVVVTTPLLRLMGSDYRRVNLNLRPADGGWRAGIDADEASGDLLWRSGGEGWVEGRLRRLIVRPTAAEGAPAGDSRVNSLPGMNLVVDDLHIGDMALGRLEVKANNTPGAWRMEQLSLQNPDGTLNGKGVWANTGGRHQTQLEFELNARDVGKLLNRLGHVDAVRRGTATLSGKVQWNGPPTGIHYPSLSGQMRVNARNGQFNQIDPGVGKLLGLISLQALPRRLTLDFRDIFSDGLAFDSIDSRLAIDQGIMRTVGPLRINGPAAQIEIEGETDLRQETQDLRVVVRPEVGSLAAVGAAALVNPVVGVAVLAANTVLRRPLNRLISYRYHVTGTWSDPQVNTMGQSEEAQTAPQPGARP